MIICKTYGCPNLVEGTTEHCGSCNSRIRKIAKQRQKAALDRELKLSIPQQPRAKIKKVSEKRKVINEEYFKLVEQFKKDNPKCNARINDLCTGATDDPHHSRGRGVYLLDVSTWIPVCRSCHIWIGSNHADAIKRGLIFSRLEIKQTI